ncbi:protein toll-like isoform X1 [Anastrepha obliqua]|uniref:protein toll-like isoform X1 n=2 Tax=Anastrepha obliqua TaxID=95512 RepID=UPI00240A4B4F|nr:protein toll-like isoform X1 [Anastrepha obliqua]XP_054725893.1 protein toll-like isoform X1 [Anastrepha obliqua]XP_054725894.1 protein toll-like isoform X1 [Anastrepha obliqua]XP_054725895.1 protein toll-like isoform X1 [Anastrepha obliqua]
MRLRSMHSLKRLVSFKAPMMLYIFIVSLSLCDTTHMVNVFYTNYFCESAPVATCFRIDCASLKPMNKDKTPQTNLSTGLFANLPNLEELHISCGLETLPMDLFINSTKITSLNMNKNLLTTFPKNLLNDQQELLTLDLSNNRLQSLPDTLFHSTKNLRVLKLSHNQLVEITSELFSPLASLEHLHLDNNNLVNINFNAFRDTANLKFLSLENNQIDLADANGTIDNMTSPFQFLHKIEELNLRNNSIKYLHRDWKTKLIEMKKLDLSYNNIRALNVSNIFLFFISKSLAEVNLTHNLIAEIDFDGIDDMGYFLSHSPPLRIHLDDNPLTCNCVLEPFLKFVLGEVKYELRKNLIISANKLICSGTPLLRGKKVIDLRYEELGCPVEDQYRQGEKKYVIPFSVLSLLNELYMSFICFCEHLRRSRDDPIIVAEEPLMPRLERPPRLRHIGER